MSDSNTDPNQTPTSAYTDQDIVCRDCQNSFVWSAGEQQFFASHQFQAPKRCKPCRSARKAASAAGDPPNKSGT